MTCFGHCGVIRLTYALGVPARARQVGCGMGGGGTCGGPRAIGQSLRSYHLSWGHERAF